LPLDPICEAGSELRGKDPVSLNRRRRTDE
jgi:hypothetical protein